MKKTNIILLLFALCIVTTACSQMIMSLISNDSNELIGSDDDYEETVGGSNPPETLHIGRFSITFDVMAAFSGGTYAIHINEEGLLTKTYSQPRGHEPDSSRHLTHEELSQLVDVILENDFFNLPKRQTDGSADSAMEGSTSTFITITVDGRNYISRGSGNRSEASNRQREISLFITELAKTAVPLPPDLVGTWQGVWRVLTESITVFLEDGTGSTTTAYAEDPYEFTWEIISLTDALKRPQEFRILEYLIPLSESAAELDISWGIDDPDSIRLGDGAGDGYILLLGFEGIDLVFEYPFIINPHEVLMINTGIYGQVLSPENNLQIRFEWTGLR